MVQANELRLGNYIRVGGTTAETRQTYYPREVDIAVLYAVHEENRARPNGTLSVYMPIELTPELLGKAGFVNNSTSNYFRLGGYGFELYREGHVYMYNLYNGKIVECKYLHQLQNLYHALTNQELKISLI